MIDPETLATAGAGGFFLTALLMGVVKYLQMVRSSSGQAHIYVDTAHRAGLLYSFACLLLFHFAEQSGLPEWLDLIGVGVPLFFFVLAELSYIVHGLTQQTDNQIRGAKAPLHGFMLALIGGEIGGFLILLYGWLAHPAP